MELQLNHVLDQKSKKKRKKALDSLPKTLDEAKPTQI